MLIFEFTLKVKALSLLCNINVSRALKTSYDYSIVHDIKQVHDHELASFLSGRTWWKDNENL